MTRALSAQPDLGEGPATTLPNRLGGYGEIVDRTSGKPQRLLEYHVRRRIRVVAIHVVQQGREFRKALRLEVARGLHAVGARGRGACRGSIRRAPCR